MKFKEMMEREMNHKNNMYNFAYFPSLSLYKKWKFEKINLMLMTASW